MSKRIDRLAELVGTLLGVTNSHGQDLLHLQLTKGRGSLNTQVGLRDMETIHQDLSAYDSAGYSCMDEDKWRNAYFKKAIQQTSGGILSEILPNRRSDRMTFQEAVQGVQRWLEIGPGALGTLTRMVLDASGINSVVAIEAVPASAEKLKKALLDYSSRLTIVTGLAGHVPLPSGCEFDALIAEILGHFASSEGYVAIIHLCSLHYPSLKKTVKLAIPAFFGTKMVPVDLSKVTKPLSIGAIGERLTLFSRFPFADAQLSSEHGFMELYSSLDELIGGETMPKERCFKSQWFISSPSPRSFHGFAFYLVYGSSKDGPWESSNFDTARPSKNWSNVFVPIGRGAVVCLSGDVITCNTICFVGETQPRYCFEVEVRRQNLTIFQEAIWIDYSDMLCRIDTVKNWRRCV